MSEIERVRDWLAEAKLAGQPFDEAWRQAVASLGPPSGGFEERREHATAVEALRATRPAWQRAYDDEPAERAERAAVALVGLLDDGHADSQGVLLVA